MGNFKHLQKSRTSLARLNRSMLNINNRFFGGGKFKNNKR